VAGSLSGVSYDYLETKECLHGRIETRRFWVSDEIGWLTHHDQWKNICSAGMVESIREIQGKVTTERRFFITSIAADATVFARAVRGHWALITITTHLGLICSQISESPDSETSCQR